MHSCRLDIDNKSRGIHCGLDTKCCRRSNVVAKGACGHFALHTGGDCGVDGQLALKRGLSTSFDRGGGRGDTIIGTTCAVDPIGHPCGRSKDFVSSRDTSSTGPITALRCAGGSS